MHKHFLIFAITAGLLLSFSKSILAQTDTEFWFVAPRATDYHEGGYPIKLKISSFGQASSVTLSIPQNEPTGWPKTIAVPANGMIEEDLTLLKSYLENWPFDNVLKKGLHITATSPVTVYYEIGQITNGEIFALKGANALGTEFYTPATLSYNVDHLPILPENWYNGDAWAGLDVVATQNNTTVKIIVSNDADTTPGIPAKPAIYLWKKTAQQTYGTQGFNCPTCDWQCSQAYVNVTYTVNNHYQMQNATKPNDNDPGWGASLGVDTTYNYDKNTFICVSPGAWLISNTNNTIQDVLISAGDPGVPAGAKYLKGDTITVVLNAGETYNVRAYNKEAGLHLGGTKISSDKPIAVTVNEDTDNIGICQDIIGDQIVPINIVGKEYIAVVGETTGGEDIVLVGTENITKVVYYKIDGTKDSLMLNAGEVKEITVVGGSTNTGKSIYIKADKSIYVYQVTSIETCEAGSALLPPIICTGSKQVAISRTSIGGFAMVLLTKNINKTGFTYALGTSAPVVIPASKFSIVPGTNNEWVAARITYANREIPTNTQCVVSNSIGIFHLGVSNGYPVCGSGNCPNLCTYSNGVIDTCISQTNGNSTAWSGTGTYGYFSNFGAAVSTSSVNTQIRYAGCETKLWIDTGFVYHKWLNANMVAVDSINDTIVFAALNADTTVYVITPNDECGGELTTKYVITPTDPLAGFGKELCGTGNDSIRLGFSPEICLFPGAKFKWFKSDTLFAAPDDTVKYVKKNGTYNVYFFDGKCMSKKHGEYIVNIIDKGIPEKPKDTIVCAGGGPITLDAGKNTGMSFKWSTGLTTDTNQTLVINPNPATTQTFYYTVTITNACLSDTMATHTIVVKVPVVQTKNDTLYTGCSTTLTAPANKLKYHWSSNTIADSIDPAVDTLNTVKLDITKTTQVKVWYFNDTIFPMCLPDTMVYNIIPFMPKAGAGADVCSGEAITLRIKDSIPDQTNIYDDYNWFDVPSGGIAITPKADEITFTESDTLWLVLYLKTCVSIRYPYKVIIKPKGKPNIPLDTIVCAGGSPITLDAGSNPGMRFKWSTGLATDTTQKLVVNPSSAITQTFNYTVTITNLCGNDTMATHTIVVKVPVVQTDTTTLYTGCSTTLTAPANKLKYHWWSSNASVDLINPLTDTLNTITRKITDTTQIKVWYFNDMVFPVCLPDTMVYNIIPFMPSAYFEKPICSGESVTVNASNYAKKTEYDSIAWFNYEASGIGTLIDTTESISINKTQTVYLIYYYKGCQSKPNPFIVTITQYPPDINIADTVVCPNEIVNITLNDDGRTDLTYNWSNGNQTKNFTVPTNTGGGVFYYTVTVTTNLCGYLKEKTMKVTILQPIVKPNTDVYYTGCNITLNAPAGYTDYHWSNGPSTTQSIDILLKEKNIVKVWYNQNKCGAFDTTVFNLTPMLPEAGKTDSLCVGGKKILDVSDQKFDSLYWYEGSSTTPFSDSSKTTVTKTGIYKVVFYYRGCISPSYTFNLTIVPDPKVEITNVEPICIDNYTNKSVVLNAVITPENLKYKWNTGDSTSLSITATEAKQYTITATNICQVTAVASKTVKDCPITVPNVFLQSSEGYWHIDKVDNSVWSVTIYNRWGRVVFKTDHYQNSVADGWDGGNSSDGVYFWVIINTVTGEPYVTSDEKAKEYTKDGRGYVHLIRD